MVISSGTPSVLKDRSQLKLASVKRGLYWLVLLRNLFGGTIGFRRSNVVSASDFSPTLSSSAVLSSFSVSKRWSPAAPGSHALKFKSSLPAAGIDYGRLYVCHLAGGMQPHWIIRPESSASQSL